MIIRALQNYLNRNTGVIINTCNTEMSHDGEFIHIKIPVEQFNKFDNTIINESKTTTHTLVKGLDRDLVGVSELRFEKGKRGFVIEKIEQQ